MAVSWASAKVPGLEEASPAKVAEAASPRVFSLPGQVLETNHPGNIAGLDEFLETVVALSGAQAGVIRALTHDGGYLRLMSAVGLSEEFLQRELLISVCGVCGERGGRSHARLVAGQPRPHGLDGCAVRGLVRRAEGADLQLPLHL